MERIVCPAAREDANARRKQSIYGTHQLVWRYDAARNINVSALAESVNSRIGSPRSVYAERRREQSVECALEAVLDSVRVRLALPARE
jgi:hypothetical protein